MIGAFFYKGIPSSNFDLICKSVSRPLLPALKSTLTSFPGVSGSFDSGGTQYDLRNITMKIQYFGKTVEDDGKGWQSPFYELRSRAREIAAWLGGGGWGKLVITGEEDKYYWAKIEEDIELDAIFEYGEAEIPFVCQPFAYAIEDLIFTPTASPLIIDYPGTRRVDNRSPIGSKFDLKFQTSGIAEFGLNGRVLRYDIGDGANPVGGFILDNVEMHIIGGRFANISGAVDQFLFVQPGENILTYSNATNLVVTIRPMFY